MEEKKTVVKLAEYKGLPTTKRDVSVTDEEVEAELQRARTYASTTQDKPGGTAEMGDQAVIDFVGYIDGEAFEGGDGEDYPLVLGSNTFIPGFEEQLVGAKVGDQVDVRVPFPENYHEKKYAGRDALFKVTVKNLRSTNVPELSDEVVAQISPCQNVDEFRDYVRGEITKYKKDQALQEKQEELLEKVVESSEIDIPQELVDERAEVLKNNLIMQLQNSNSTLEDYMDYHNLTEEELDHYNSVNALNMLRGQAVLGEIAKEEGLTCSDEELEQELYIMARSYQTTPEELREMLGEQGIAMVREDMVDQHALDFLVENSVES